jgi:hypothetical protein
MHSEYDNQMKIVSSEITSLLNLKGIVFLVLTNDHLINAYVENKLITGDFYGKKVLKTNGEVASNENTGEDNQVFLVEIPKFNNEVISYFSSIFSNENTYYNKNLIYLIQEPINPKFIEFIYTKSALSTCIFLSDRLELIIPDVLNELLNNILGQKDHPTHKNKILNLALSKKISLSKLFFFSKTTKTNS